jgi:hypothetical protein
LKEIEKEHLENVRSFLNGGGRAEPSSQ